MAEVDTDDMANVPLIRDFKANCNPNGEYSEIPDYMWPGIQRYIVDRIEPGDFLTAVITNNLFAAVGSADSTNLPLIPLYVRWFYNVAPSRCWGSPRIMLEWLTGYSEE